MRKIIWSWVRRLLFCLEAETAHSLTVLLIRLGVRLGNVPLRIVSGASAPDAEVSLPRIWGIEFESRVGLAAGFDKNAEIIKGLPALGFGFVELGTVTPRPQAGNPRPRLFREPSQQALFNRMGFNGLGANLVAERLGKARGSLPSRFRVGVNLGKNKETPNESAWRDYVEVARAFEGLADYLVINVSSPNTPGLRSLQSLESLRPIVQEITHLIGGWKTRPPLLLKLAPEVSGAGLCELVQALEPFGIDGWVLTNTLAGTYQTPRGVLEGGWSGGPLTGSAERSLELARQVSHKPIISVGGILSVEEARRRMSLGADLVQIYTGWIYQGPAFPAELSRIRL